MFTLLLIFVVVVALFAVMGGPAFNRRRGRVTTIIEREVPRERVIEREVPRERIIEREGPRRDTIIEREYDT